MRSATKAGHILFINAADTSERHQSSANAAIYPNLGLLQLMSSLEPRLQNTDLEVGYFDGTVYGNDPIARFIEEEHNAIFALCFSAMTANYGASVALANQAKKLNPRIIIIFGNDHFSALYQEIMINQPNIDFGFYGNDVVEGFSKFLTDLILGSVRDKACYPGLVYRPSPWQIKKNSENHEEYSSLPLVNYSLMDSFMPHRQLYSKGQKAAYPFMKEQNLNGMLVDIGRGCIKFAGRRVGNIPVRACDFCGIIPGSKPIVFQKAGRAWAILKNAYEQGFNYFYVMADELPMTFGPPIKRMMESIPDWYKDLSEEEKPKMFGYARADAFIEKPKVIDSLINGLNFIHFFVGFDGLSEISLKVMNKQDLRGPVTDLMEYNMRALEKAVQDGCMITAGIVLTHLGITPEIMQENYKTLEVMVENHPDVFAALDFGPLCPLPGSQSFRYLQEPDFAEECASRHGLQVDRAYLESIKDNYIGTDLFGMNDLIGDFIRGCCPDISPELLDQYIAKTTALAEKHGIVVGGGV